MREKVIIIADNDKKTIEFLSSILKRLGHNNIVSTVNEQRIIELCKAQLVNLLLINIACDSTMNWITTAKRINTVSNAPVIFISPYTENETCHYIKETENYGYITKPFQKNLVRFSIQAALDLFDLKTQLLTQEKVLRSNEQKYKILIDNSNDLIMRFDQNLKYIYVSPSIINNYNISPGDYTGKHISQMGFSRKSSSRVEAALQYVFKHNRPLELEFEFDTNQGNKTFKWRILPETDNDKNLTSVIAISRDTSKEKKSEAYIRYLTHEIINSQELERQRIAKDLHDSVTQTILAAKLNFSEYKKDPVNAKKRFEMGLDCISRAAEELREIYTGIYPSILNDIGLEATIRWYAKNYLEVNNIAVIINFELSDPLQHNLKITLYRIVQELLSNILKHSKADRATVSFQNNDNHVIQLTITDNGTGFDINSIHTGKGTFGLSSIRHRCEMLNGSAIFESTPGKGSKTTIRIPEYPNDKN